MLGIKTYLYLGVLAAVVLGLVGGAWYIYGEGKRACEVKNLENGLRETNEAIKDGNNAEEAVNRTVDIDALLIKLGIMRNDTDR